LSTQASGWAGCYECGLYGGVLYTGPGGWAVAGLVAAVTTVYQQIENDVNNGGGYELIILIESVAELLERYPRDQCDEGSPVANVYDALDDIGYKIKNPPNRV